MALPSLYVNGQDVAGLGLLVEKCQGPWSLPAAAIGTTAVPGRAGAARTGSLPTLAARTISVSGRIFNPTGTRSNSDVLARLDTLKPLFALGLIEVRTTSQPTRAYLGRTTMFDATIEPAFAATSAEFSLEIACDDPLGYDTEPRCVSFGASPVAIALGTGPSGGILRIGGPATNPVVTYRDLTGTAIHTLGFTRTLAATDYEEIDLDQLLVTRVQSGVSSNDLAALTSGDLESFTLSPEDGDAIAGVSPTLECSGLTGTGNQCQLLYFRSYL